MYVSDKIDVGLSVGGGPSVATQNPRRSTNYCSTHHNHTNVAGANFEHCVIPFIPKGL